MFLFALVADVDVMIQRLVDAIAFMFSIHINQQQVIAVFH